MFILLTLTYFKVNREHIIPGNMTLIDDSMDLFQMGMALEIPGIAEKNYVRGFRKYVEKQLTLLVFSMFQLTNWY